MKKIFCVFGIFGVLGNGAAMAEVLNFDAGAEASPGANWQAPESPDWDLNLTGSALDSSVDDAAGGVTLVAPSRDSKTAFPRGLQFGMGVSATSGFGGFVGYANKNFDNFWLKRFGVRADFATSRPIDASINSAMDSLLSGANIGGIYVADPMFSMHHIGATVDFYPFGNTWLLGGLRISGGYKTGRVNAGAGLAGNLDPIGIGAREFELGGTMFKYLGGDVEGRADMRWNWGGPYIGTGFDLGIFRGIKFYTDFGVVFTRAPQAVIDAPMNNMLQIYNTNPNFGATGWRDVMNIPEFEQRFNDAKAYAVYELNDFMNDIMFFPMVKFGMMYRF